jgi:hypothetical protein
MRIAYVIDLVDEPGVIRKIGLQLQAWRADGHEVEAFVIYPRAAKHSIEGRHFDFRGLVGRAAASRRLRREVLAYQPDVAYLRYDLFMPPIWRLVRAIPTVVELNTDDLIEFRARGLANRFYNQLNHRVLLRSAKGIVGVTAELVQREKTRGFVHASAVIGNGIDLPDLDRVPELDASPRLVFLGGNQSWHGVDVIAELAVAMPSITFDLVGIDDAGHFPENVRAHGVLSPQEYERVLLRASAGIGPLALHRKGLQEAAPIKIREYLAHGLPIVIAHRDPDIDAAAWFVHSLPKAPVDAASAALGIADFLRRILGRRVLLEEIRDAVDYRSKERVRLKFVSGVASHYVSASYTNGRPR